MEKTLTQKKLLFKRNQGLTLIEVLLVTIIIGALVAALSFTVGYSKKRARDERRKADLRAIVNALELKYNENLRYPNEIPSFFPGSSIPPGLTILRPELDYVPTGFEGRNYFWYTDENKQKFCLYFQLEINNKWFSCMTNGCRMADSPCQGF